MTGHLKANNLLSLTSLDLRQSYESHLHGKILYICQPRRNSTFKLALFTSLKPSLCRKTMDPPYGYELFT